MTRVTFTLLIGGVLILISWVTSPAALTPAPIALMTAGDVMRIEQMAQAAVPITAEIDEQAAKLRARLSQPPPPPAPTRNPFVFGTDGRDRDSFRRNESRSRSVPPVAGTGAGKGDRDSFSENESRSPLPVSPALPTLVAITSDGAGDALILTAALAMGDEVKLVRVGQPFDRFIVDAIGVDSVRLVDSTSPTRATFTIAIR